jgi:hypothetical protein
MGWLKRLFGMEKPENAQVNPEVATQDYADPGTSGGGEQIDPERVGLNGEYDQSGLAKRVALAFDEDSSLTDIDTLWVAQTGSTVVLKGSVPSQDILNQMVAVALDVNGATNVDTDQVTIG